MKHILAMCLLCSPLAAQQMALVRSDLSGVDVDAQNQVNAIDVSVFTNAIWMLPFSKAHSVSNYPNFGYSVLAPRESFAQTIANSRPSYVTNAGGCYLFDGIDDYMTRGDSTGPGTGAFTIAAWYYPTLTNIACVVFGKGRDNSTERSYGLFATATANPYFMTSVDGSAAVYTYTTANKLTINAWQFLVGTKDGTATRFYHNAVLVHTNTLASATIYNGTMPLTIGAGAISSPSKGYIDNVMLFNRALSGTEVTNLFNQTKRGKL